LAAYEKLKNNKEDMTAGLDGLSLTKIDDIIERIKTHTYQFKPIKFIYISNSFGTFQSIGISGIEDKLVQKVMAMILEAIYDFEDNNIFVDSSHGFRRARSTHTALMEMSK
jgi:retron-type reverse transcriptase